MVGTGTHAAPHVGMCGKPRQAWIHHEQLAPALQHVGDPMAVRSIGVCHNGVVAPHHGDARTHPFGVVVAIDVLLRIIAHHERACRHHAREDARAEARHVAEREGVVGAAEAPCQTRDVGGDIAPRSLQEHDALCAELLLVLVKLGFYGVKRLVPRDPLPPVLAAVLTGALHRVEYAVFVVHEVGHGRAPGTQAPLAIRIIRIALDLHDLAVLAVDEHAATQMAPRRTPGAATRDCEAALFVSPRFLVLEVRHAMIVHDLL